MSIILYSKPYKEKHRKKNPSLEQTIRDELDNTEAVKVIYLIHYSQRISNLVLVRKKTRDICLCVYFLHLNKFSLKDNYHVAPMEEILQEVYGVQMMCLLNSFPDYNYISLKPSNFHKTKFVIHWDTYPYHKTPFYFINVGSTF